MYESVWVVCAFMYMKDKCKILLRTLSNPTLDFCDFVFLVGRCNGGEGANV